MEETVTDSKKPNYAWLNVLVLIILVVLFVYSVRFNHKCRRRRKKLPHEIRFERKKKQIHAQRHKKEENRYIFNGATEQHEEYKEHNEYLVDDAREYEIKDDVEYDDNKRIRNDIDDNDIGLIENGKLLINNINHYVQTQYDQYKDTHSQIVQDMLGMNEMNENQHTNDEYEPI